MWNWHNCTWHYWYVKVTGKWTWLAHTLENEWRHCHINTPLDTIRTMRKSTNKEHLEHNRTTRWSTAGRNGGCSTQQSRGTNMEQFASWSDANKFPANLQGARIHNERRRPPSQNALYQRLTPIQRILNIITKNIKLPASTATQPCDSTHTPINR